MKIYAFTGAVLLAILIYCTLILSDTSTFLDDFTSLDENLWDIQIHSFDINACDMKKEMVQASNSKLKITVDRKHTPVNLTGKNFLGGGLGTKQYFKYGRFSVRLKNSIQPGTVSSFFLINRWKKEDWKHQEIDIEFLGKNPSLVQFTIHHYTAPGKKEEYAHVHDLGFDSTEDFHEYSIEWRPEEISWWVDRQKVYTETRMVPRDSLQIRVNHWAIDTLAAPWGTTWLGRLRSEHLPSHVEYEWVRYKPLSSK
ncbi:family 16 glycosylhydrolase [Rapidithrix thailandica]|uniref:Beta-glucanase n=1 Tax=Rapidithrix thailandica TaxID=413964 RepID=A0AAW9RYL7_9BACT